MKQILTSSLCALALASVAFAGQPVVSSKTVKTVQAPLVDWKTNTIEPVTNPIFFEDPFIRSEIRPIYIHHNIDKSFVTAGGSVNVYALQIRYALTDRLAIIATKDGYIDFDPNSVLASEEGFADIAAGLKYALIDLPESQFILSPGFKFSIPLGNQNVFQGNGSGEWDIFVSAAKGFGNAHLTTNVGVSIPNDSDFSTSFHFSAQLDYYVNRYFVPFFAVNGFTVLNSGNRIGLDVEGFDLINFGSSAAEGYTQVALGAGFRSRILDNLDIGFAFEKGVTTPRGLFDDRYTVDLVWRF